MTILVVCAVYDSATQGYARPFFTPTWAFAQRGFMDAVQQPDSPTHAHPDDYELRLLAMFDDEKGVFLPADKAVLRAKDCVFPKEKQ